MILDMLDIPWSLSVMNACTLHEQLRIVRVDKGGITNAVGQHEYVLNFEWNNMHVFLFQHIPLRYDLNGPTFTFNIFFINSLSFAGRNAFHVMKSFLVLIASSNIIQIHSRLGPNLALRNWKFTFDPRDASNVCLNGFAGV